MELPFHDLASFYWWGFHVNVWGWFILSGSFFAFLFLNATFKLGLFDSDNNGGGDDMDETDGIALLVLIAFVLFAWPVVWIFTIGFLFTFGVIIARQVRSNIRS